MRSKSPQFHLPLLHLVQLHDHVHSIVLCNRVTLTTYSDRPMTRTYMKKNDVDNLQYNGETNGVHGWMTPSGQPYYWHPDWLHIAEDATGLKPKQALDVAENEQATKKHAVSAILKHINQWASEKLAEHPEIETEAIESQIGLKK